MISSHTPTMSYRWGIALIVLSAGVITHNVVARSDDAGSGDTGRDEARPTAESSATPAPQPAKQLFRGKVIPLQQALKKRDIRATKEMDGQVVLETEAGELIPILADWRGRAFYQDKRLRDRKVELVGFRHAGVPYLQVLMVYTFDKTGRRQYTDYWCDICSIPMYEMKPCECCQGEIRLRFQDQDLPDYLQSSDEKE